MRIKDIPTIPPAGYIYYRKQRSLIFLDERDMPVGGMRGRVASKTLRRLLGLDKVCRN